MPGYVILVLAISSNNKMSATIKQSACAKLFKTFNLFMRIIGITKNQDVSGSHISE